MKYHIVDKDGNVVVTNIEPHQLSFVKACSSPSEIVHCEMHNGKCRRGILVTAEGSIYLCTDEEIKSTRLFKEKQKVFSFFLEELKKFKLEITDAKNQQIDRLIHDLITYNARTLQSLYKLIPQEDLGKGVKNELKGIKDIIERNIPATASTILRIIKNENLAKAEFSAFKKLFERDRLEIACHPIQKVIYLILNTFRIDLNDDNISIDLEPCDERVAIDYESVSAALTKIIENIAKYIFPKSTLKISFQKIEQKLHVYFDMISLKVNEDEKEKIFEEGYSGFYTKKAELSGKGIGLYLAKNLLKLNNAVIKFFPNIEKSKHKYRSLPYENNRIELIFRLC